METSNTSRKYKNRRLWTVIEEEALVGLWEEKIGELRANRKNSHIYAEMANRLLEMNIVFTPEEVKCKVHNLTNRYRNEKKSLSEGSPSEWHLFNMVDQILGGLKTWSTEIIIQDSITGSDEVMAPWSDLMNSHDSAASIFNTGPTNSNISAARSSSPSSTTSNTSARRAKKRRKEDDLDEEIRKTLKVIRDTSQEFLQKYEEVEKERNDHLKELINILKS